MNLCKDCFHYDGSWIDDGYPPRCLRPVVSYIHGTKELNVYPEDERTEGECGPEGKFFIRYEKKEPTGNLFSKLFKRGIK